jgi:chaperonin cofactor prefoldin
MKEQMKETIIVSTHNCLQQLKGIVETQQTQINLLVSNNEDLNERIKKLENILDIQSHLNSDDKRFI